MCSHYEAPENDRLLAGFGVAPESQMPLDMWPLYLGPFIRLRAEEAVDDETTELEALTGQFGLLPFWAKDRKFGRHSYNCRSETGSIKPSFKSAWKKGQKCIIPVSAFFEPDWRSGKAIPTRITRTDGGVMAVAGLWERWKDQDGQVVHSYTMLTINADAHPFMSAFHKPNDEKRSIVILPNGLIKDWLKSSAEQTMDFMQPYPADRLMVDNRPG
ncbi:MULTISPECIES: SOS response-associated peptidase [unclassified Pseudomonas]|uniref:SOS response-associated peptidase n=1 Tax=unclassified Pseudomonas TaxID=196821 RepID=UPI001CBE66D1|nr:MULTISPECIES: SOS response-associated peptidase family protein [unclassified Pseudomonas]